MRVISLDFETYYSETCSVGDLAPRAYVNHPEFYAYMASVSDGEETWAGDLADFNPESLRGNIVVSHNAAFDRTVASKVWGPLEGLGIAEWNCTANLAACLCGRRSLADAVHHLFGVQLSKAMRSYMKGRHWRDVKNTPEGTQLLAYAKDDAIWCRKIWTDFLVYWGDFERQLSLLTIEASANGVQVDCTLLDTYLLATNRQLYEIEKKLPWVQTGGKPTSPKAIAIECRKHGIPCPPVKDEDEDLYEEWEETYKDQFEWVLQVGEWRSCNKLLKTLQRLELRTEADGEMDTPLKFFGAHTGRWSGDNGVNLQNLRKDAPTYGGVDINMRALFVARPGCKLIVADFEQIEPRCLAWCTGDWKFLEMVGAGMSPYEAHARISMGWTGGKLKDEAPDLYALNKAMVLALGYGCGAERFIQMAWNYCELDLPLNRSQEIVADFRTRNPKIVGIWNELERGLIQSVGQDFEVVLPSGRILLYADVRRSVKIKTLKDPLTGKISTSKKAGTMATSFGRKTFFYGGKLCENLIQAMARDVFGVGLLRLRAAGYKILFTVHDEVVIETPMDADPAEVKRIMEQPIEWAPGLPVAAEVKEMQVYRK